MLERAFSCESDAVSGVLGRNNEGDRSEQFLHELTFFGRFDLKKKRCSNRCFRELSMTNRSTIQNNFREFTRSLQPIKHGGILHADDERDCADRIAYELTDCFPRLRPNL